MNYVSIVVQYSAQQKPLNLHNEISLQLPKSEVKMCQSRK